MKTLNILIFLFFLNSLWSQSLSGSWQMDSDKSLKLNKDGTFVHNIGSTVYTGLYAYSKKNDKEYINLNYPQGSQKYLIVSLTAAELKLSNEAGQQMIMQRILIVEDAKSQENVGATESKRNQSVNSNAKFNNEEIHAVKDYNDEASIFTLKSDLSDIFILQPFLGASINFAHGGYIDYQNSFNKIIEENSIITGGVTPYVSPIFGIQFLAKPFSDKVMSNFGLSLGIQYLGKGFINKFESTHSSLLNYKDYTSYNESFKLNYFSFPIKLQWGRNIYANIGLSYDRFIRGNRIQKIKRNQSGEGAINGGFELEDSQSNKISNTLINTKNIGFQIGGGFQIGDWAINITTNLTGNVFTEIIDSQLKFKNSTIQLQILKNIYIF